MATGAEFPGFPDYTIEFQYVTLLEPVVFTGRDIGIKPDETFRPSRLRVL